MCKCVVQSPKRESRKTFLHAYLSLGEARGVESLIVGGLELVPDLLVQQACLQVAVEPGVVHVVELAPVEVRSAATTAASSHVRVHKVAQRALLCYGGYSQKRDKRAEHESGTIGAGVLDCTLPPAVLVLVLLFLLRSLLQALRGNLEERDKKKKEREIPKDHKRWSEG